MSPISITISINGMHCGNCGILIDDALEGLPGVTRAATNVRTGKCRVQFDPQKTALPQLASEITALGYAVRDASDR